MKEESSQPTPARNSGEPQPLLARRAGHAGQAGKVSVDTDTDTDTDAVMAQATGARVLTTNQGVAIADNQNSLKAGLRGPTLLEDFILREKLTHFDHERIPERIVHAVKPEPHHGMPQAASAHDTFWDFVSLSPETTHMLSG